MHAAIEVPIRHGVRVAVRHLPPRGRGLRVASAVNRLFPPSDRLYRTTFDGGTRITCDLRDAVQAAVFYRGVYEDAVTHLLQAELRPGDVFVDIGANIGYFTLLASRRVGPAGRVHAFEPSPALAARLALDVAENPFATNVTVHHAAVADRSGEAVLVSPADVPSPAGEQYLTLPGTAGADDRTGPIVRMVTVDEAVPDLVADVVKVDVEGAERRVLHGMQETMRRSPPRLMLIEVIDRQLARFGDSAASLLDDMAVAGYAATMIEDPHHAPMMAFRPAGRG